MAIIKTLLALLVLSLLACGAESSDTAANYQYQSLPCEDGGTCEEGPSGLGDHGETLWGPTEDPRAETPPARRLGDRDDFGPSDNVPVAPVPRSLADQLNLGSMIPGGSTPGGGVFACDQQIPGQGHMCVSVNMASNSEAEEACADEGGTLVSQCPPGAYGRCVRGDSGFSFSQYVYAEGGVSEADLDAFAQACMNDSDARWEPL